MLERHLRREAVSWPRAGGWWSRGINHGVKQGRPLRFINGNDLSICWSQFTRVSWAQRTMGRPTYELPAPLRRVHKTTGIAAGEHPETPPLLHGPPDDTDGAKANKDGAAFVRRGTPFKSHSCNKLGKSGHATLQGLALLLAWALRHSKWNQIYGPVLQNVVKIKRTLKAFFFFF